MKKLIVTRSDLNINEMTKLTHPIIKNYAKKCNADFQILSHTPEVITDDNLPHFRIMRAYDLFNEYDRVMIIDSDVVITPSCPDIFKEVPKDSIGSIYEDKGSRKLHRLKSIQHIQRCFGNVDWKEGYINTGVFLCSKEHKNIFQPINDQYYTASGSDDVHLGWQIHKHKFKIHELSFKWNHMSMFSEPWNNNANRFDSYIIHYAGAGNFPGTGTTKETRVNLIKSDIKRLYT